MSHNEYGEKGGKFIKSALILSITGIISKILGAIFRNPLSNWIGAVGMSYYGVAYPIYSFFLIIATAGLPVAVSKMVSERIAIGDYENAHRTYKTSLYLMAALGVIGFSITFFGADAIARAMGNPGGALSLRAIAPALLTAPIVSSFRGYSQGQQRMLPTGASEVTEQLLRVIAGLSLSYYFLKFSVERVYEKAAAGATFGASAGSLAALILLFAVYIADRKNRREHIKNSVKRYESTKSIFKQLLNIAVPVTIGSAILPIMTIIDAALVMNILQNSGWSVHMSKRLYGLISGFCDPLIGFPQVFTIAVAVSLVPAISEAYAKKRRENVERNVQVGIKTSMVMSFPCMIGLIVLAKPILHLLYPNQLADADLAAPTLQILSLGVVCLSILRTFSSVLQGIGKAYIPVVNLTIGVGAKFVITLMLVGIHDVNIKGAAVGNVAAYGITAVLNYRAMRKHTGAKIKMFDTFGKPFIASAIMGVAAFLSFNGFMSLTGHNSISVLAAILIAVIVYVLAVFAVKALDREEILMMPKGEKILKAAEKMHLIR